MWCQESASVTVCYTCSDPILTYVLYYSFFLVFMSKKSKRVIVIFMVLNFDFWLQKIFSVLRLTVKTFWSNLHFCHVMEKLMDLCLCWKCVTKLPLSKDFLFSKVIGLLYSQNDAHSCRASLLGGALSGKAISICWPQTQSLFFGKPFTRSR